MDMRAERSPQGDADAAAEPLVVALEGAMSRADLLAERALAFLRGDPLRLFPLLLWLLRGRATLERELRRRVPVEALTLPTDPAMERHAAAEKAKGRRILLAAGGNLPLARAVAERWGFVDEILPGQVPGALARLPAGDAPPRQDAARAVALLAPAPAIAAAPGGFAAGLGGGRDGRRDAGPGLAAQLRPLLACARPHQWAKNTLVFVPAVLSGQLGAENGLAAVALAFVALCILASGTYLLNDLWDVADDRRHWSKRRRPIASGRLPIATAMAAAIGGILAGLALGAVIGSGVLGVLGCYLALTLAYSFAIKRVPILDVGTLAGLFTLRLLLGIVAAGVFASPWLLVFSMFLFASLCFAKRYVELERAAKRGDQALAHRGYRREDGALLLVLGPAMAVASIVVLVLYVIFDAFRQTFYGNTVWLWAFPVILFLWTSRVWIFAVRGELDDDPVAFAVKDAPSVALGAAMLAAFILAWSGAFA